MLIQRQHERDDLRTLLRRNPVVAIVGARQVGKTTLARMFAADYRGPVSYFLLGHLRRRRARPVDCAWPKTPGV